MVSATQTSCAGGRCTAGPLRPRRSTSPMVDRRTDLVVVEPLTQPWPRGPGRRGTARWWRRTRRPGPRPRPRGQHLGTSWRYSSTPLITTQSPGQLGHLLPVQVADHRALPAGHDVDGGGNGNPPEGGARPSGARSRGRRRRRRTDPGPHQRVPLGPVLAGNSGHGSSGCVGAPTPPPSPVLIRRLILVVPDITLRILVVCE